MIVLVNMPFSPLPFPCLATGLIKARLNAAGLLCREFNLGFLLAEFIGARAYQQLAVKKGCLGEWLFAGAAWPGDTLLSNPEFLELAGVPAGMARDQLLEWRSDKVPAFLDAAMDRLMNCGPVESIGFSCSFCQTNASFALIRRIKSWNPQIKVVCGGSAFHDIMGTELMDKFDLIDAACLGEADDVVVPLFRALGQGRDPEELAGVRYRNAGGEVRQGPAYRPVAAEVLDRNPHPDFDDYFSEAEKSGLLADDRLRSKLYLAMETSRGCWKGQKRQCAFCGLNHKDIEFRRMSIARVVDGIAHLARRYPLRKIMLADRIMPRRLIQEMLPELRKNPVTETMAFWAESGSNLTRAQVRRMAQARVLRVQTGIENLSTNILECMRKGVTALQNVYFLKLCRTYGVYPLWTILVSVPGEKQKDYDDMSVLIPKLVHFTPPVSGVNPVRMHRFSPYFNEPGRWADNIRPWGYMRGLFPADKVDLEKVAFDFDADWKDILPDDRAYRQVMEKTQAWMDSWRHWPGMRSLVHEELPGGGMRLVDTRLPGRKATFELSPGEASLYRAIDDPAPIRKLKLLTGGQDPVPTLERFIGEGVAISENGRCLGLAIPKGAPMPAICE